LAPNGRAAAALERFEEMRNLQGAAPDAAWLWRKSWPLWAWEGHVKCQGAEIEVRKFGSVAPSFPEGRIRLEAQDTALSIAPMYTALRLPLMEPSANDPRLHLTDDERSERRQKQQETAIWLAQIFKNRTPAPPPWNWL
jgi:hypothetical protein